MLEKEVLSIEPISIKINDNGEITEVEADGIIKLIRMDGGAIFLCISAGAKDTRKRAREFR